MFSPILGSLKLEILPIDSKILGIEGKLPNKVEPVVVSILSSVEGFPA